MNKLQEKYKDTDFSNYKYNWAFDLKTGCYGDVGGDDQQLQDCLKVREAIKNITGMCLGVVQCANIWHKRSDAYDASWLILPDDDRDIVIAIVEYTNALMVENYDE